LIVGENNGTGYSDAQVDDYHHDGVLRWRPPCEMRVRARISQPLLSMRGTAGFGFWNDPLGMTKIDLSQPWWRSIRLPQAVWFFFAGAPTQMKFALDGANNGWKAATLDASSLWAKAMLPFAPLAMLACRWQWAYRRLWPLAERVLKIAEVTIPVEMEQWHDYKLRWEVDKVTFWVDDLQLMSTTRSPRGSLGFVAWVDNQFMIATPQGRFDSGLVATPEQRLDIENLEIMSR
jgi:hypothetical protein